VAGFGGMRHRPGQLPSFAPRLPPALTRLTFMVYLRGRRLRVAVLPGSASYLVDDDGPPLEITHHGQPVTVSSQPVSRDIPAMPIPPRPAQPPGREAARRVPPTAQGL
jgi:alpha,alpha-trehalose phosphorylase